MTWRLLFRCSLCKAVDDAVMFVAACCITCTARFRLYNNLFSLQHKLESAYQLVQKCEMSRTSAAFAFRPTFRTTGKIVACYGGVDEKSLQIVETWMYCCLMVLYGFGKSCSFGFFIGAGKGIGTEVFTRSE